MEELDDADLSRVLVVGTTCAGKTTYARQLSQSLGVPHIELDALYWLADWVERPNEEFRTLVGEAASGERWVVDGNYGSIRDTLWTRATSVIWLNYPFFIVAGRGLRRTVKRCITREELYAGNRETFSKSLFSRDSILRWLVTTYGRRKREYRDLFDQDQYPNLAKIEFTKPRDAAGSISVLSSLR